MNVPLSQISLHQQLADVLRREVLARQPGEKLESEVALAKRFGVSALTAHQAMVLLAHDGLVVRRRGSGSFVAERGGRGGEVKVNRHIAVLIDKDISHPRLSYRHRRVAQALVEFFERHDMSVRLYTGRRLPWVHEGEPTCYELIEAVRADQIQAVASISKPHPAWADVLRLRGVPVVYTHSDRGSVMPDYEHMVRAAVDRLHARGRHRIALLGWYGYDAGPTADHPIRQAFAERMRRHGLLMHNHWVRDDLNPALVGAGWEEFREIWSASREKPNGLVVTDDILFHDAAVAILGLHIRVPEQLAVVAQANKGSDMLYPFPVDRMEVNPDDIAHTLGEITLRTLDGRDAGIVGMGISYRWLMDDGGDPPSAEQGIPMSAHAASPLGVDESRAEAPGNPNADKERAMDVVE